MDYTSVPTLDETAPRPCVIQIIRQPDVDGPRAILHRGDCAQGRDGLSATDAEPEDAVREGGTVPCQVCHPERARRWRLGLPHWSCGPTYPRRGAAPVVRPRA
ncbi:hypothetical protein [Streptantibioticus ferralitis]|uniref:Uncharacterized protein n=1 Tax=Streptantibioticus ferralitis TaxID=236510 RepID=A0ABT5ZC49_9ACTN|nr:hypothetical protein [Streptantibioticus ferralitis]MDF2261419.1 hypothetical protein [Streptantibioticus ferralitis]